MGFWSKLSRTPSGITANAGVPDPAPGSVGPDGWRPGDPDGVTFEGFDPVEVRSFPALYPSPWSGWPAEWSVPNWDLNARFNELVDVAWACLDLNASVLSTMPVYRTRNGRVVEASTWMSNPDPSIYTSWHEFAKQLFWDYQLGEAFVLPVARFADGFPMTFRVIPPWMMFVDMRGGVRRYRLGEFGPDVSDEILHIRYKSTTDGARGVGPLEAAGGRMLTAGVLAKYVREIVSTGGVPEYTLETDAPLTGDQAQALLTAWMASRAQNLGAPAVLDNGLTLKTHQKMSPKDMAMLEIAQFTESRIAVLLGVPPFLVGLPSGGDSMCVDEETQIFTRRGWVDHGKLIIGEDVFTLNHDTGLAEWQPLLDVNTFAVVDRAMVSIEMQGHSSFSTDDHRWPVVSRSEKTGAVTRRIQMSRDLKRTDAFVIAAPCSDLPTDSKYTDALVEVVAWFYTEGTVGPHNAISIAQSDRVNPAHVDRIRAAVRALCGPVGWSEYRYGDMVTFRLSPAMAAPVLATLQRNPRGKVIDRSFFYSLTQAQLDMFIEVSVWADGCESNGQITFKQKSEARLERFELACILAGRATMMHRGGEVTVRRRPAIRPVNADRRARRLGRDPLVTTERFTGIVWCPTTPNGTWFARRRGTTYFTHNTYSNVSSLFDFHDRSSLRPKASHVMAALSDWALPGPQKAELNRDEYSRPSFAERATAWVQLVAAGIVSADEVRAAERLQGEAPAMPATAVLTGGET